MRLMMNKLKRKTGNRLRSCKSDTNGSGLSDEDSESDVKSDE